MILAIGCKEGGDDATQPKQYYFAAETDGEQWRVSTVGQRYFGARYDDVKRRFTISVAGYDQDTGTRTTGVIISFDFLPRLGRYYFNNTGSVQPDSGVIGTYLYRRNGAERAKWSTSGYVDIESFTRDEMKGSFLFASRGDATDSTVSVTQSGSFYVPYGGGGGSVQWTGP